jgi:hypothetical protein
MRLDGLREQRVDALRRVARVYAIQSGTQRNDICVRGGEWTTK